jgi:hypothetical protein
MQTMNTPSPDTPLPTTSSSGADNTAADFEEKYGVMFYRGSRPFEELDFPPETAADAEEYEWAMHDPQVRQQHRGLVVAVRGHKVWGAGKNPRAAWEQASKVPGCPPPDELLFVDIPDAELASEERKP